MHSSCIIIKTGKEKILGIDISGKVSLECPFTELTHPSDFH